MGAADPAMGAEFPIRIIPDTIGEPVPLAFRAQVVQTAQATLRYD
jgi:hypothetical protein